mmetsp:Transcript_24303/g.72610  ORF Transcript_24303/g.72610 Transcript_24303/m.72610 type:complete len:244 (-) Transcript_24303:1114-1845(-)
MLQIVGVENAAIARHSRTNAACSTVPGFSLSTFTATSWSTPPLRYVARYTSPKAPAPMTRCGLSLRRSSSRCFKPLGDTIFFRCLALAVKGSDGAIFCAMAKTLLTSLYTAVADVGVLALKRRQVRRPLIASLVMMARWFRFFPPHVDIQRTRLSGDALKTSAVRGLIAINRSIVDTNATIMPPPVGLSFWMIASALLILASCDADALNLMPQTPTNIMCAIRTRGPARNPAAEFARPRMRSI